MSRVVEDLATILARELMDANGLTEWRIAWCDHMEEAGRCHYAAKVIVLNRHDLLDTAARNIRETILHEIAHALVAPDDEHDRDWWEKLIEIGGDGIWVMNNGRVTFAKPREEREA